MHCVTELMVAPQAGGWSRWFLVPGVLVLMMLMMLMVLVLVLMVVMVLVVMVASDGFGGSEWFWWL